MTAPGTRVLAGSLLVSLGLSEDRAEDILRAFTAADLDIVKRQPPVEPYTGEKAENPAEHVANLKAIVRSVTKPTEYEEKP